jgi:hypothetical protein
MTIPDQPHQPSAIEAVCEQFEQWRQTRKKRTAIPEHLWAAAIELSENHSVCKISKTLGLNYTDLQKRIQQSRSKDLPETIQPKFIGFEIGNKESAEVVIEMVHQNGASMKAHISGSHIDFLELSKIFFGRAI